MSTIDERVAATHGQDFVDFVNAVNQHYCEHRDPRPAGWADGQRCGFPASAMINGRWMCEAHGGAW